MLKYNIVENYYIYLKDYLGQQSDGRPTKLTRTVSVVAIVAFFFLLGDHSLAFLLLFAILGWLLLEFIIIKVSGQSYVAINGLYLGREALIVRSPRSYIAIDKIDEIYAKSLFGILYYLKITYSLSEQVQERRYFILSPRSVSYLKWVIEQKAIPFLDFEGDLEKVRALKPERVKSYRAQDVEAEGDNKKIMSPYIRLGLLAVAYVIYKDTAITMMDDSSFKALWSNSKDIGNRRKYGVMWPQGTKEFDRDYDLLVQADKGFSIQGVSLPLGGECSFGRESRSPTFNCEASNGVVINDLVLSGKVFVAGSRRGGVRIRSSGPSEYRGIKYKRNQMYVLTADKSIYVVPRNSKKND